MANSASNKSFSLILNGRSVAVGAGSPGGGCGVHTTLLDLLRKRGLMGAKEGCAEGECGAEANGVMEPGPLQRFVYVLEGELETSGGALSAGGFLYCPPGQGHSLRAGAPARAVVIEKPYQPLAGWAAPTHFRGHENEVEPQPLLGDPALEVRALVPADATFDFAVNTMTYQPGATLPMVEIHFMEHGLLMLAGDGIYRLGEHWYPVTAGDFIWMGPYCPQWFGALGKAPAKYLIYKDWSRHPAGQQR